MKRCNYCGGQCKKEDLTIPAEPQWPAECTAFAWAHVGEAICPICVKEFGRKTNLLCRTCGYSAIHFSWGNRTAYSIEYICPQCKSLDIIDSDIIKSEDAIDLDYNISIHYESLDMTDEIEIEIQK